MEFIEPEEFLKEDKEVQEVINNSIKLNIGDRIYHKLSKKYYIYLGEYNEAFWNVFDLEYKCTRVVCKDCFCRCLHEGQLRKFIEDKTNSILDFDYIVDHYEIFLLSKNECIEKDELFDNLGNDLLQAYWEVAVQIAREEVLN